MQLNEFFVFRFFPPGRQLKEMFIFSIELGFEFQKKTEIKAC